MTEVPHASLKKCNRCEQEKPATPEFFPRDRSKADGFSTLCKVCKYAPKPAPPPEGYKQCGKCEQVKPATEEFFTADAKSKGGRRRECKQCMKERHARYYQEHAEHLRSYSQEWQSAHKEHRQAYNNQWNAQYRAEYYHEHRDYYKNYGMTHREQARAHYHNREARIAGNGGTHTPNDIERQIKAQKGRCYYCHKKVGKNYHVDHVIPLSRGGSNGPENLVIACPTCNMRKHDRMPHEWAEGGRLL